MATYYVDPTKTGGTNSGGGGGTPDDPTDEANWTNAWTTLQRAIDGTGGTQPTAGDTVFCRGTETVSVMIDFDGLSGSAAAGHVKYVGVNASGVEDGTLYTLDANDNALAAVANIFSSRLEFRNLKFCNCGGTGHGVKADTGGYWDYGVIINCEFTGNNGTGFWELSTIRFEYLLFVGCKFTNNGVYGSTQVGGAFFGCVWSGNPTGNYYISSAVPASFNNCIFRDNTNTGFVCQSYSSHLIMIANCVFHGNTVNGLYLSSNTDQVVIYGCRFTSNGTGIVTPGTAIVPRQLVGCYFPDTGQPLANTTKTSGNDIVVNTTYKGVALGTLTGTDADGGYTDSVNDDYSLASSASLRNVEIAIDGTSSYYFSAGLIPDLSSPLPTKHPLARF